MIPPVPIATIMAPIIHPGKPAPCFNAVGVLVAVMISRPRKYTKQKTVIVLYRPHRESAIMAPRMGKIYAKKENIWFKPVAAVWPWLRAPAGESDDAEAGAPEPDPPGGKGFCM